MIWNSPHIGGVALSWNDLMEMDVWDRNVIATRVEELREAEREAIAKATGS